MNSTAQKNTDYPEILRKTLALAESWQNRALDLVMIIYEYLNAESDKKLFDRLPYSRCQIQDFLLNDITAGLVSFLGMLWDVIKYRCGGEGGIRTPGTQNVQ